MRTPTFRLQDILHAFERRKVLTKQELLDKAGCSTMTAWRLLRQHGYLTSYNDNARHYTLVGIPQFDEHGLWAYRHVRFSQWGSLTKTIVGLVQDSAAGWTAEQLRQLLQVTDVKPILSRLSQRRSLTREKVGGRFVYFSTQPNTRAQQHQQRKTDTEQAAADRALPPQDQILALLVEIICRPRNTPRQWARRLRRQGIPIGTRDIQGVLAHYGIDLKKGLLKS